jgi:hypothetical protein
VGLRLIQEIGVARFKKLGALLDPHLPLSAELYHLIIRQIQLFQIPEVKDPAAP